MTDTEKWTGLASVIQTDLKTDAACARHPWPCLRRWLLGGPACGDNCKACKSEGGGKGAEPCRTRAAATLAKLVSNKAISPDLLTSLEGGKRNRA